MPLPAPWCQRPDAIRETLDGAELAEADRHPDPLAEAIRWQICKGALVQIIGRGRGVNRTADNPLDVLAGDHQSADAPAPKPVPGCPVPQAGRVTGDHRYHQPASRLRELSRGTGR